MTITGYSDRINHALAFAAKHHDRQVHRGARMPYWTHAANVAIILTRYGADEDTVVAGILQEVVADCVEDRFSRAMLDQRIGDKFGQTVLEMALSIIPRREDETGVEFSHEERREDLLRRLASAGPGARWVAAAACLHDVSSTLADLRRTIDPESVWSHVPLGREGAIRWYRQLSERLADVGFREPIILELGAAV